MGLGYRSYRKAQSPIDMTQYRNWCRQFTERVKTPFRTMVLIQDNTWYEESNRDC